MNPFSYSQEALDKIMAGLEERRLVAASQQDGESVVILACAGHALRELRDWVADKGGENSPIDNGKGGRVRLMANGWMTTETTNEQTKGQ